jgi:hypothetical protein
MRQQRRSECNRGGEPQSHKDAVNEICKYARSCGYEFFKEYPIRCCSYEHNYDVVIMKEKDFVFGLQKGIGWLIDTCKDKRLIDDSITHIVEVGWWGDDTKHSKKTQTINDGIARVQAEIHFRYAKFVRINKDDCFNLIELKERIGL